MVFHITYKISPENRNAGQKRFKETGAPPPAGVTMTGRWHSVQGLLGFIIAESSDAEAIGRWTQEWTDVLSFEITPVLNDEEISRVIG
jgi:hypothetical protein